MGYNNPSQYVNIARTRKIIPLSLVRMRQITKEPTLNVEHPTRYYLLVYLLLECDL